VRRKKDPPYCVVYHSTTVGVPNKLVERKPSMKDARDEVRRLNRGAGMGGFYNAHRCASLGYEFRKEIGLEGRRRRRR
jgi:hypothetical protein